MKAAPITKRQHQINKAAAKANGDKTFIGYDCTLHHGGERYEKSGDCVICSKIRATASTIKAREKRKLHFAPPQYVGGFLI